MARKKRSDIVPKGFNWLGPFKTKEETRLKTNRKQRSSDLQIRDNITKGWLALWRRK